MTESRKFKRIDIHRDAGRCFAKMRHPVTLLVVRAHSGRPFRSGERWRKWIVHACAPREQLRQHDLADFAVRLRKSDEPWTHLVIFQNVRGRRHVSHSRGWHDDSDLQALLESAILRPHGIRLGSRDRPSWFVAATERVSEAILLIRRLLREEIREQVLTDILKVEQSLTPPFPVVERLGGSGWAGITYKVLYQGRRAVCKLFREDRLHVRDAELAAARAAWGLGIGPEIVDVRDNWILYEYLADYRPISAGWGGMLDPHETREAFRALRNLHSAGYVHFDFNSSNVLLSPERKIRLVDFEDVFPVSGSQPPFAMAPVFSGRAYFDHYDIDATGSSIGRREWYAKQGPKVTYEAHWKGRLGMSYEELERGARAKLPRLVAIISRMARWGKYSLQSCTRSMLVSAMRRWTK
jgi:predicted Ser/Thr protein kinase